MTGGAEEKKAGGYLSDLYKYYVDDRKYKLYSTGDKDVFINNVMEWAKDRLIGVRYKMVYSNNGYKNTNALYSDRRSFPNYSEIHEIGMNCIGLINLIRLRIGLTPHPKSAFRKGNFMPIGCLHHWDEYFIDNRYVRRRSDSHFMIGTLLYTTASPEHIAIYIGDNKILHCYPNKYESGSDELLNPGVEISNLTEIDNEWKASKTVSRIAHVNQTQFYFDSYVLPKYWLFE